MATLASGKVALISRSISPASIAICEFLDLSQRVGGRHVAGQPALVGLPQLAQRYGAGAREWGPAMWGGTPPSGPCRSSPKDRVREPASVTAVPPVRPSTMAGIPASRARATTVSGFPAVTM